MTVRAKQLLTALALLLAPAVVTGAAEKPALPAACRTVVYSTNPQYPPYDWSTDGRNFDGASIELLNMVLPPGVSAKPALFPWKRSMFLAESGQIDLLASLRITPERERYLVFTSHRAFPNPIVFFKRKDRDFPYRQWKDLVGLKGGMSAGDTFGGGFDQYWRSNLHMEEAPSMLENYQKLDSGRIDYFVTSLYAGQAFLAKHPTSHEIVPVLPAISNQDIHFGFSKKSPCAPLAEYVSTRLRELDAKGVPQKLLKKHLKRYMEGY
ncbi:substrate-binding periplasmic protein [Geomonas agri]|uniref:substrate-binding periplasmic protein n=1 Tax=Geomonas agri TaxID=2873702 RepID=UPI001CD5082B|nr:transporter substrate-binding domain-containing protein [Geomonas agri]